jgi:Mg/Co/Ni transporter MgtE
MGQAELAEILNNMAPDDRTRLLDESPAAVTKHLLALSEEERRVALSLLGYREGNLGAIGFFRIALWSHFSPIYGPHWLLVGLTVGFSLIGIVMWGALAGSMLPFILRRAGLDPATSSAPFVATLVDVTGLVIYFSVAYLFMRGKLL